MSVVVSLCMVVRNEQACVEDAILSVKPWADEFCFLDTGSTDDTFKICSLYGRGVRLSADPMDFDFGEAKTAVSWMARGKYIFLLDADERLSGGNKLRDVVKLLDDETDKAAIAIPRRRWADIGMTKQVEKNAWPDFQARLYRNDPRVRWTGALHEKLGGQHKRLTEPLVIEHFQDVFGLADPDRATRRMRQRAALARKAGVTIEGSDEAFELAMKNLPPELRAEIPDRYVAVVDEALKRDKEIAP